MSIATPPAPLGRRFVALFVDWILCSLIASGFLGMKWGEVSGLQAFLPLGLLFVENAILVTTLGTTLGHRLMGIRVVSVDGDGISAPPPGRSALRALLLCLGLPAMIMDGQMRGLHDKAARSMVVRTR